MNGQQEEDIIFSIQIQLQNTKEQQEPINMHGYLIIQTLVQHMDVM